MDVDMGGLASAACVSNVLMNCQQGYSLVDSKVL